MVSVHRMCKSTKQQLYNINNKTGLILALIAWEQPPDQYESTNRGEKEEGQVIVCEQ